MAYGNVNDRLAYAASAASRRLWDAFWDWQSRRMTLAILRTLDRRTLEELCSRLPDIERALARRCAGRGHR